MGAQNDIKRMQFTLIFSMFGSLGGTNYYLWGKY